MKLEYYLAAAVFAPLLMLAERLIARRVGRRGASLGHAMNSISHYMAELALTVTLNLNVFAAYAWLEGRIGLFPIPKSPASAIAAFLAIDFVYYVGHRTCHALRPLWGLHAVHHQSREMNLASGLRGPWLSALQIAPFLLPLAVLGLPPEVMFGAYAIQTVYKLVIHTEVFDSLGPLDAIFVSPAAHRVHHARDAVLGSKNFGGVLSIWDRMFGTWAPAEHATLDLPLGLPGDEPSLNPLANNLAGFGIDFGGAPSRRVTTSQAGTMVAFVVGFALTLVFAFTAASLPVALRFVGCAAVIALVTVLGRSFPRAGHGPRPAPTAGSETA